MRFTITVNATLNGKPCKNPKVEFIQGEQFIYPCEIKGNQITIEVKPGYDPNACIEGYIKCDDACLNCPPQYFKQCLCNDVTVLQSCQKCVDGFIVDTCTPEQIAAGMICTPDGCQCPPDKPIKDPNTGQCVQCITGTVQGCKICVAGTWVDKECGDNEVCDSGTGGCVCKPGFVKDPYTNLCVPPPQCSDDVDCPTCYTCVLGNCVPVICPPDHKCVDGECIYWPCKDATCSNGADCGEGCGCLNGQCVPCYLLPCTATENGCTSALGCQCNNQGNCEPIPNCGQPCDGMTPCTDPGCTCYNGQCVNCANFPCNPDDCSDRANCGCAGGNCGGSGEGCADELELVKKCGTTEKGCEVEAKFTAKTKCPCEPIIYKTKNTTATALCYLNLQTQTPIPPPEGTGDASGGGQTKTALKLDVRLFKGELEYAKYLEYASIGDDELVSADIVTTVTHYVIDSRGNKVEVEGRKQIDTRSVLDNKVTPIEVKDNQFKKQVIYTDVFTRETKATPTIVLVEVFANRSKINNNDCVKYDSKRIAVYELDHKNVAATCSKIKDIYTIDQKESVYDSQSTRRPLFVWSKSNTGVFNNARMFDTKTNTYNQSGWFRKEYGVKVGGAWVDKINHPKEQNNSSNLDLSNQTHELWANYNYRVQVDCGCKVNTSFLDKLVFCCPDEFEYSTPNCNTKFELEPFSVCAVNGNLTKFEGSNYKIPNECQVNWMVRLKFKDGSERDAAIPYDTNNPLKTLKVSLDLAQEDLPPVVGATVYQKFNGGLLSEYECPVDLDIKHAEPNYKIDVKCSPIGIVVSQLATETIKIKKVSGAAGHSNITFKKDGDVWTTIGAPGQSSASTTPGQKQVFIEFENGCLVKTNVNVTCQPSIEGKPVPSPYSDVVCDLSATGPKIVATPTGFTNNVKYSIDGVVYQDLNEFLNMAPGTYTIYAKDTIDGVEYIATTSITILPSQQPVITLSPKNICTNGSAAINIAAEQGMTFEITTPTNIFDAYVTNADGTLTIPGLTAAGTYTVKVKNKKDGWCALPVFMDTLTVGGTALSPTIVMEPISPCIGSPITFRINDGGQNETYFVSTNTGIIKSSITGLPTATIQAQTSGADNGIFIPSSATSQFTITAISGSSCNTLALPVTQTVTAAQGPVIGSPTDVCSGGTHTVSVNVTGATSVTIGGITAAQSGNTYTVSGITTIGDVSIIAQSSGCQATSSITLQSCSCPQYNAEIIISDQTCNNSTQIISFYSYSPQLIGQQYQLQELINGLWTDIITDAANQPGSGTFTGSESFEVYNTTVYARNFRVKFENGQCTTNSNEVYAQAQNPFTVSIQKNPTGTVTPGQQVTLIAVGAPSGSTFAWSGPNGYTATTQSITVSQTQVNSYEYFVTATNGQCSASASTTITVGCGNISFALTGNGPCDNPIIVASSNNGPLTYKWFMDNVEIAGQTTSTFDASIIPSGAVVSITGRATDALGCIAEQNITYSRCNCVCSQGSCVTNTPSTLNIDGTFQSYNGSNLSCAYTILPAYDPNIPNSPDWVASNGTPDVWDPSTGSISFPTPGCVGCQPSGLAFWGLAYGMTASPQGGKFAAAGAWFGGEEIATRPFATQIGSTYTIRFKQAFAGNSNPNPIVGTGSCTDNPTYYYRTLLGDEARWRVSFGDQTQDAAMMSFEGAGNQTWAQEELTFVANSSSTVLKFKCVKGTTVVSPDERFYIAIDDIEISGGPTC